MKCVIPNPCLKTFSRAVFCLAKIGEEIYIEALADALSLKTTNCARTAYTCVLLRKDFFLSYDYDTSDDPGQDTLKCKLAMRPFLSVFKSLPYLDKSVDHCMIQLDHNDTKLVVSLHYKQGFIRSHHLGFEDCDGLQAVFSKGACPVIISGSVKVLQDVAANFPQSWDEITVLATADILSFKSYCEDDQLLAKQGITEINLSPPEFEEYTVLEDTSVVCSLKTMRALLTFAEAGMHYFKMRIECSGKPVVLSLSNQGDYEVDMVLATLVEPEPQGVPSSSQISTVVGMWTGTLPEAGDSEEIKSASQQGDETAEEGDVIDDGFDVVEFENPSPIPSPPPTVQLVEGESLKGSLSTTDSIPGTEHLSTPTETSVLREEDKDSLEDADFGFIKKGHENPYSKSHQLTDELFGDTEDEISDSLVIPGTPEAKRYKDSIWDNYQSQPGEEGGLVLAPDSDPED